MRRRRDDRSLTQVEQVIMDIIRGQDEEGMTVRQIIEAYPEPKPFYSTVATHLKILSLRQIVRPVKDKAGSKALRYIPLVSA